MATPQRSTSVAAWRKTLEPWLSALKSAQLVRVAWLTHDAQVTATPRAWFGIDQVDLTEETWNLLWEAMELMELLARVEPRTAWELLTQASSHKDEHHEDDIQAQLLPRFRIFFEADSPDLKPSAHKGLHSLLGYDDRTASENYQRVKTHLLSQWEALHDGRVFDRDHEGRVSIVLVLVLSYEETGLSDSCSSDDESDSDSGAEEPECDPELLDVLRSLSSPRSQTETPTQTARVFSIESVGVRLPEIEPKFGESFGEGENSSVDTSYIHQQLREIAATGARISHLELVTLFSDRLRPSGDGRFALDQLVNRSTDDRGVQSLKLSGFGFDATGIHALCTAIARSPSLRSVTFRMGVLEAEELQHVWWPWLFYALFSRFSDHAIQTVYLNLSSLAMDHISPVRDMLGHSNPLALLPQSHSASDANGEGVKPPDSQIFMATIDPSARIFLGHHDGSDGSVQEGGRLKDQVCGPAVACQVVRDRASEPFIEVFVPGAGVGWVLRSHIKRIEKLVERSSHPVRDLYLSTGSFHVHDSEPMAELLSMIGGPIERLKIDFPSIGVTTSGLCGAIVAACPNLVDLNLEGMPIESLDWLLNAPATFQLARLSLYAATGADTATPNWASLFLALSDPSDRLSHSLRHLRIDFRLFANILPQQARQTRLYAVAWRCWTRMRVCSAVICCRATV